MQGVPSAFWIDVKSKIKKGNGHDDINTVEGILEDAAQCDPAPLVVFIVYDLPNRDCYALASNGEICCHKGADLGRTQCLMNDDGPNRGFYKEVPGDNCADGLTEYKETYIDPFAEVVGRYAGRVPVTLIIEPDSLPNMVTNMADSRPNAFRGCTDESRVAYEQGIKYAVEKFSQTHASIYVDSGHGGWLGWANAGDDQTAKFAQIISGLQISHLIRGFSTNVAGYQPLGSSMCTELGACKGGNGNGNPCCTDDPCGLQKEWNWAHNELNYVSVLHSRMAAAIPGFDPHFVIDTGRNGNPATRSDCGNWCNVRGAGIGLAATSQTADQRIDAYFWLKTPGESDGCTEKLSDGSFCPRFDEMCASTDSIGSRSGEPRAPEAGLWFHYQITQLASKAVMGDVSRFQGQGQGCSSGPTPGTLPTAVPSPTSPAPTPTTNPGPGGGGCCKWEGSRDCGSCGDDGAGWCHRLPANCIACGGTFDSSAQTPACDGGGGSASTAPTPPASPTPAGPDGWDSRVLKATHYWDCNGQHCDSSVLQPWDESKYVSPPGYGPQDPADHGGAVYGEKMWLTGAASDSLATLLGGDDPCCGSDQSGACGKCLLIQNPGAVNANWTAVVMKKNRCPPWTNGCGANEPHFDVAAPGFDNLQWSTANVCGIRAGTGFENQSQSEALGSWYKTCADTSKCIHLCDQLRSEIKVSIFARMSTSNWRKEAGAHRG